MSRLEVTWDWFWSVYNRSSEETRHDLLRQLNIEEVLRYGNIKLKKEIFEHAPQEIITLYKSPVPSKSIAELRRELYRIIRR